MNPEQTTEYLGRNNESFRFAVQALETADEPGLPKARRDEALMEAIACGLLAVACEVHRTGTIVAEMDSRNR